MRFVAGLLVCFMYVGCCGAVEERPWRRHVVDDSSRGADGVRLGDINGDGLFDIVTGWEEGGVTRVYLHPGYGKVQKPWPAETVGPTKSVEDAVFVDMDADGVLDVVSCCEGGRRAILVHWGPQKGSLLDNEAWKQQELPAAKDAMMWMFAVGMDVDGANGIDLVAGGKGGGAAVGWLEAPADGRMLDKWKWHKMTDAGWIMSIAASDMDGDGDQDVVITDRKGDLRGCRWLENPGIAGRQTQPWTSHMIGGQGREAMFMRLADIDCDGLEDVLVAAKSAEVLLLRRLDNSGKRWTQSSIPYAENMGTAKAVAVGDIDVDGKLDIVISCEQADGSKSGVKWMSHNGEPLRGQWTGHEISGPDGIKFDRIELVDADGDGDLDPLICEERYKGEGLGIVWYENPHKQKLR